MSFITRQPNGLLCRFSSITDRPEQWNMTEGEYIAYYMEKARDEARMIIKNEMVPFERVREDFVPNNMTEKNFEVALKQMELPVEEVEQRKAASKNVFRSF